LAELHLIEGPQFMYRLAETVGPMVLEYARHYTAKVAELRKTDLRIDWV
jgi:hypothetical protein